MQIFVLQTITTNLLTHEKQSQINQAFYSNKEANDHIFEIIASFSDNNLEITSLRKKTILKIDNLFKIEFVVHPTYL